MANDGPSRDAQQDRIEALLGDIKTQLIAINSNTSA